MPRTELFILAHDPEAARQAATALFLGLRSGRRHPAGVGRAEALRADDRDLVERYNALKVRHHARSMAHDRAQKDAFVAEVLRSVE